MAETFRNFIGGEWGDASGGETFPNHNPADLSDVIGEFPASGEEDVSRAVDAAVDPVAQARPVEYGIAPLFRRHGDLQAGFNDGRLDIFQQLRARAG